MLFAREEIMPLTAKGEKIMQAMIEQYGEEEGKKIFYASKNAGTITGVDKIVSSDVRDDFNEADHPRDEQGKFTEGGSGGTSPSAMMAHQATGRAEVPHGSPVAPGQRPLTTTEQHIVEGERKAMAELQAKAKAERLAANRARSQAMLKEHGEKMHALISGALGKGDTVDDYNNPHLHFFDPSADAIEFFGDYMLNGQDAPLTAARRKNLPEHVFALPGRRYPIDTPARARSALARVMQHGTESEQKAVYAAVRKKYPDMEVAPRGSS
jgi:hypothetical protein